MLFDTVVFYNWYGNGDLFNSREFVKDIMNQMKDCKFFYAHGKNKRMFADISNLEFTPIAANMRNDRHFHIEGSTLFINTWIGVESKYVLPGIGCTIEKNIEMYNDMFIKIGLRHIRISKYPELYLPKLYYEHFDVSNIDDFVTGRKKLVLVCNGPVHSMQAENFDMSSAVINVAKNHHSYKFILTQPVDSRLINMYSTDGIIKSKDGFDLNEISYLSRFCNKIIGRASGPYAFAQTYENCMDPEKTFLTFCYDSGAAYFLRDKSNIKASMLWSGHTNINKVSEEIEKLL